MMGVAAGDVALYDFYRHCIGKQLKISLWPRRCHLSGKSIWLKKSYRLTAMWTGPGDPIFEHRWHDVKEHLFWELKK